MLYNKRLIKGTARVVFFTMVFQLVSPLVSSALTSGPTQPEVSSFEPVGTTDMVDLFTGDFVYNIPLLDVEGYPINISYHSGGDMEQEASWVGYGWNINPGVVNRSVRGLPDDFNGETISKTVKMKPEQNVRVGVNGGMELFGVGEPILSLSLSAGGCLNFSNYRGVSADINLSMQAGVNIIPRASAGVSFGAGSQSGADVNYNLGLSFSTSQLIGADVAGGFGVSFGHGYNTRSGVKDQNFSISTNASIGGKNVNGPSFTKTVPIGIKNIVPAVTNSSSMRSFKGQLKVGGEALGSFPHLAAYASVSKLTYNENGSKKGYGYFYAQNATVEDLHDFTRDRDGMFNESMDYLPLGNMTYDIYSVSGQGTGGSFRPFRNDYGTVFDPVLSSDNNNFDLNVEVGFGGYFELGGDGTHTKTDITSGPWDDYQRPFTKKESGSIYENVFFKQAGELTMTDTEYLSDIGNHGAIKGSATKNIPLKKRNTERKRDPRANLVTYFTGEEASKRGVASTPKIPNYAWGNGFPNGSNFTVDSLNRVDNNRKAHYVSEVVQTQTDGRRYVYGIAAMNTTQNEYTFAVNKTGGSDGLIDYGSNYNPASNESGRDHYYSNTSTPAFAHSFLLTAVLSTDYVDVTGNGPSDDDLGSYTKFNYTRKNAAYKWRAPYRNFTGQFYEGFKTDKEDDKASYLEGTREQWIMHSIETKNYIAEFHVSERHDGTGAGAGASYKLDEIRLYNKHERFTSPATAVPVKTVIFNYDYSLCKGVHNNPTGDGKLTLKKIYIKYGNSEKSMLSPYQFEYDNNYSYQPGNKDRWGMYKPAGGGINNIDFPFVNQTDTNVNKYAAAWSLSTVKLPSGGTINVDYEADDYAYVQNKEAMEMFKLEGVGNGKDFNQGAELYSDKNSPNNYFYFRRDTAREDRTIPFRQRYLKNDNILYYNVTTSLTEKKANFEPIKGYGEVVEIDTCTNSALYAYVRLKPITPVGGGASVNPVTYTAINFGRYHLPHVIFPGNDPDKMGLMNILSGLSYAIGELVQFSKNPIKRMVQEGKAKKVTLNASFIRLNSPGLTKKGGGQRVKELRFSDNWSKLSGNGNKDASYGKRYKYTLDNGGGKPISSGVASYEPQIGGDENPFRMPANYIAQSQSNWPPNDPVGLYQELPIGESLYPGPVVGYSRVVVESIHKDRGNSAQGVDIHEFYTAKEFPIIVENTAKDVLEKTEEYDFQEQNVIYRATQGYVLKFNDMHGKPKRNEHRVAKPGSTVSELVNYTQYNYQRNGGQLNNEVPTLVYDANTGKMKRVNKVLGVESDLTIDTRDKKEFTTTETWSANLNVISAGPFPIPIPWLYPWWGEYNNEFSSVVATKVIQQYGILMEVETYQEGAITKLRNEAFDPVTGQALITSVNNEYNDKEYSVNYPGYWGYKAMGPAYANIGYEDKLGTLNISNYRASIQNTTGRFMVGDELYLTYYENNVPKSTNVWVMEANHIDPGPGTSGHIRCLSQECDPDTEVANNLDTVFLNNAHEYSFQICGGSDARSPNSCRFEYTLLPRFKTDFPQNGSITDVKATIVRSGAKNMLTETIQNYSAMSTPFNTDGSLRDTLNKVINISAKTFRSLQAMLPKYDWQYNQNDWDSLNPYLAGSIGIPKLYREYSFHKDRNYTSPTNRDKGLFTAMTFWSANAMPMECTPILRYCLSRYSDSGRTNATDPYDVVFAYYDYISPEFGSGYNLFSPNGMADQNWIVSREITKWSPWGQELENKDATNNYTTAQYGYNHQFPIAIAQNAKMHDILSEGFEDYKMLQAKSRLLDNFISPFQSMATRTNLSNHYDVNGSAFSNGMSLVNHIAHTGLYSLQTTGSGSSISFPVEVSNFGDSDDLPRHHPFRLKRGKEYIISYWYRPISPQANATTYQQPSGYMNKSDIIEGWQQAELKVTMPQTTSYSLLLPNSAYVDDIRIMPVASNMKSFVYNPINQKIMATLDENNFASFFEYDKEGNLLRTKKETEKGIMTVSESRSANPQNY